MYGILALFQGFEPLFETTIWTWIQILIKWKIIIRIRIEMTLVVAAPISFRSPGRILPTNPPACEGEGEGDEE